MLKQRFITAVVLAVPVLTAIFAASPAVLGMILSLFCVPAAWEWANLAGMGKVQKLGYGGLVGGAIVAMAIFAPAPETWFDQDWVLVLMSVASICWVWAVAKVLTFDGENGPDRAIIAAAGVLLIPATWLSVVLLKAMMPNGGLILILMFLVWGADVGAYFTGKRFGKTKLAPKVSPGKTWEGMAGGLVAALALGTILALAFGLPLTGWLIGLMLLTIIISVPGDLFESVLKRSAGIKDSSNLLPGHGGVLDRIDSLMAAGPIFALGILLMERL
ncbi:phosphatidate cytidylyltransferase [Pelagibaculum spongiae]|uniref:Phosphatidate cytidylyltransferase n=1 Tax=Pelagibaculum spongiae TaxID=2080658 RepID=A0A2V1GPM0_9GAMM|nr:phosphatidate cytidylyltransferase [Pelagibaculum spongiae]PVZ64909.1 phosphatidate cytidylyltransferase [Pelagibaculum spongiae]